MMTGSGNHKSRIVLIVNELRWLPLLTALKIFLKNALLDASLRLFLLPVDIV